VLGQTLQNRVHKEVLSTAKNFEGLVKSYGLDFVPVDADFQALIDSEEGKQIRHFLKNSIMLFQTLILLVNYLQYLFR
jgi:sterol 3beta-glucosyltransferase